MHCSARVPLHLRSVDAQHQCSRGGRHHSGMHRRARGEELGETHTFWNRSGAREKHLYSNHRDSGHGKRVFISRTVADLGFDGIRISLRSRSFARECRRG